MFAQSTTGDFGDQIQLTNEMGFDNAIFRDEIASSSAEHYHFGMERVNYFG